jgi:hypothetical protein
MIKKLILLAMAVAAVAALVAPAGASAAPSLTMPAGTLVEAGTPITLSAAKESAHEIITETELGTLECETIGLNGEVTENTGTMFAGKLITESPRGSFTHNCKLEPGEHNVEIHSISSTLTSSTTGHGTIGFTFIATIELSPTTHVECHFHTGAVTTTPPTVPPTEATFEYTPGTDSAEIEPVALEGGPCGEAILSGSATVETTGGGAVTLD